LPSGCKAAVGRKDDDVGKGGDRRLERCRDENGKKKDAAGEKKTGSWMSGLEVPMSSRPA